MKLNQISSSKLDNGVAAPWVTWTVLFSSSQGTATAAAVNLALWLGCCQQLLVLGVYVWLSLSLCHYPELSPWLMQPKRFFTLGHTASHMSDICLWRWLLASGASEQQLPGAVSLPEATGCVTLQPQLKSARAVWFCSCECETWQWGRKDCWRLMKVFQ